MSSSRPRKRSHQSLESSDDRDESVAMSYEESSGDHSQHSQATRRSESQNGIIERLEVKNFMCHRFLELELHPQVNFIIGKNGSGKSAVMTAVMIGLGSSAVTTSRGQSLKCFVKNGERTAVVTIQLRNSSSDPFQKEKYGKSIIVERRIYSDNRPGTFTIMSANRKIVSKKKEDLQRALDHFGLMVENPVCLLTQDTSRNYLHSSSPKDKYKLFMKATQLETLNLDYKLILENVAIQEETLETKKKGLPRLEREVVQLEDRVKSLDELDQMVERCQKVKHELAWAYVRDQEKDVEKQVGTVEKLESKEPEFIEKIDDLKVKESEALSAHEVVESELEVMTRELESVAEEKAKTKEEEKKRKDAYRQVDREVSQFRRDIRDAEGDKIKAEEKIREMEMLASRDFKAEKEARENRIGELRQEISSCTEEGQSLSAQKRRLDDTLTELNGNIYQLRPKIDDKRRLINRHETELRSLEQNRANELRVYGSWAESVVQDISRETGFRKKPKGPIGRYLKLKESRWAAGLEEALGDLVYSFCCESGHDYQLLQRIISRRCQGKRPSIIIQKFQNEAYNIRANLPQCREKTFLDVVQCTDPVVFNVIVDQKAVDQMLFIEDATRAQRVMHQEKPRGAKVAFTVQRDQVYGGSTNRFYSGRDVPAKVLHQSVETRIAMVRDELRRVNDELRQLMEQKHAVEREKRDAEDAKRRCLQQCHQNENQMNRMKEELCQLELVEDEEGPSDLAALRSHVEEIEMAILTLTQESTAKESERDMRAEEREAQRRRVNDVMKKVDDLMEAMESKKNDEEAALSELETIRAQLERVRTRHQRLKDKIDEEKGTLANRREQLEELIAKANRICSDRIESDKTPDQLKRDVSRIEASIRHREQTQGNREEILRRCFDARKAYKTTKKNILATERYLEKMNEVMELRRKNFARFRKSLAYRAQTVFTLMASQRNYTGHMRFDHKKKEIILTVSTVEEDRSGTADMRALSGGERSFTTVCFVVSLWVVLDSPIHILDEFDIFMDMVNRRVSMRMLVTAAQDNSSKQHIFLSPQDMSAFIGGPGVKTWRLPDPERH
ncbi:structural maintenance of chromosomes protein 6-like [Oscarella lobularis]|uniref:structural maintenance of chromosomes protein 6-like n=1 Tax=Oscarella lobularis TaxID=121494 RepID=UPI003313C0D2